MRYLRFAGSDIRAILEIVLPETYKNYESYKTDGDDNEKCCKCNHASTRSAPFCFAGTPLLWQTALYVYE
ncbi:hypothetical protein GCM10023261_08200 [Bartonella jaculi]|uniref:Uncharacterized protein n=1 Tax=Bartonella jaculi TaxID=686226 RepID=A0ABP9N295_9HYPH